MSHPHLHLFVDSSSLTSHAHPLNPRLIHLVLLLDLRVFWESRRRFLLGKKMKFARSLAENMSAQKKRRISRSSRSQPSRHKSVLVARAVETKGGGQVGKKRGEKYRKRQHSMRRNRPAAFLVLVPCEHLVRFV